MAAPQETRTPNLALIELRENAGLSQQDLADELNTRASTEHDRHPLITKKTVGRWERGEVAWPQPFYRRLLAERFGCSVDELGFRRPHRTHPSRSASSDELLTLVAAPGTTDPRVSADQQRWRDTRAALGNHRRSLAVLAEQLYPEYRLDGLHGTGVIAHPAWIPAVPVPLGEVALRLNTDDPMPAVTGIERESAAVRPLASNEQRYRRYHHAVRDLATPKLFENRLCFRLLGVDWTPPEVALSFGRMGFFDAIDTNEALAHETALHSLGPDGPLSPSWRRLTFRKLIGDPFDLTRRPLMGAVGTLTVRAGESPSVVLHYRDGARVAGGGAMAHLVPAGIFQPSSLIPEGIANDFSLWRNIQREFAEELLGHDEYDGSGRPIDYANLEPFRTLDQALTNGRIRVWCLGVTLDALTLAGDILTVAVFDPQLHDALCAGSPDTNGEGSIPARIVPFEGNTLARLREMQQLSPGAAAALELAWRHRGTLLR